MVRKSCVLNLVKIGPYITPESRKRKERGVKLLRGAYLRTDTAKHPQISCGNCISRTLVLSEF